MKCNHVVIVDENILMITKKQICNDTKSLPEMPFLCAGQFVVLKRILQNDDKHVIHEKMKRGVQAFICEIIQKGQQDGLWDGGGGAKKKKH